MEFNEKTFEKVAIPRIKKFYDMNKDAFLARGMDLKDLYQEMRIALWQKMLKYDGLGAEEYEKLINKILTTKLIDSKQRGYKHMKTEDVIIEENDKTKVIKGHIPQFLDIDSINESSLQDNTDINKTKARITIEAVKHLLSSKEVELLENILDEKTEKEIACGQICCNTRASCDINLNPGNHLSTRGNIGKNEYKKNCKSFSKVHNQSVQINRLKKQLIAKIKKLLKKM